MFLEKALLSLAEDGEERGGQAWGEGGREEGKEGTKAEGEKMVSVSRLMTVRLKVIVPIRLFQKSSLVLLA